MSRWCSVLRTIVGTLVLVGVFVLGARTLSRFGIDALSASMDLPMKIQAVSQRIDTGSFWFSARSMVDPDGRLDRFYRTGYFAGPDPQGRYWSYYANPYTLALSLLWSRFGMGIVPVLNFAIVVIGAWVLWSAVAGSDWHRDVRGTCAWVAGALMVSTLGYYGMFLWELAATTGLALIGVGIWWRLRWWSGWRRLCAVVIAGASLGIAVATRYEIAWFLLALAIVITVRMRQDRAAFCGFVLVGTVAVIIFVPITLWFAQESNGLSGGQLFDHLRGGDSRVAVFWNNTFNVLVPNVVRRAFSDAGVRALRIISITAWACAGLLAIVRWKRREPHAHTPALLCALIGSGASAAFWSHGVFAIAPWVIALPLFRQWNAARRSIDPDAATCVDVLVPAALLTWPIGLAIVPVTGGGQLGPRFFLIATSVLAFCGLAAWRHGMRIAHVAESSRAVMLLVGILFSVTAYHSAYYAMNHAYAARYVGAWTRALSATTGPIVFADTPAAAPNYVASVLRGRAFVTISNERQYPYLVTALADAAVPTVTVFGQRTAVDALASELRSREYMVRETRDLPHDTVVSTLERTLK